MKDVSKLIVLRSTAPTQGGRRERAHSWSTPGVLGAGEPVFIIESADAEDRAALLEEPQVFAVAPSMPVRLIEPIRLGGRALVDTPAGNPGGQTAWGVEAVNADSCRFSGQGVRVAVLDTGIDRTHPAFAGLDVREKDFSNSGNGDANGHGTHCAATIFGRDCESHRIGIARGVADVLIAKVLDDRGAGTSRAVFSAIAWASDQGAHVISMSLGFDFPGLAASLVEDGWPIQLATSKALESYGANLRMFDALMSLLRPAHGISPGAVVVGAAGNESRRDLDPLYAIAVSLPAAAQDVISVGAVGRADQDLTVASFSNALPVVVAPGVDICSARSGGGLCAMTGTSMAGPHAAGVAALWWEAVRARGLPANAQTVAARIMSAARPAAITDRFGPVERGNGLITAP